MIFVPVIGTLPEKDMPKSFAEQPGGFGTSGGSGQHGLRGCGQAVDAVGGRGRGYALWRCAEVSASSLDQSGAVSTHALLRCATTLCPASGTLSLEKDRNGAPPSHHADGACSSLLGPLRTHAIQGGRDMTVHGRQQPDQVASSQRGRGRGVSKTTVFRDTPSVHHIRQQECLA